MNTQDYTRIYTRILMYTLVYTSIHRHKKGTHVYLHFVYTSKQANTSIRGYAHVCTCIHRYTKTYTVFTVLCASKHSITSKNSIHTCAHVYKAYTSIQRYKRHKWVFTFVYTSILKYTRVYTRMHSYTQVYTGIQYIHLYTRVIAGILKYTWVYTRMQMYKPVYTI